MTTEMKLKEEILNLKIINSHLKEEIKEKNENFGKIETVLTHIM